MIPTPLQKISLILDADTPAEVFECLMKWIEQLSGDPSPGIFLLSTKQPSFQRIEKNGFVGERRPLDFGFDKNRHILSYQKNKIIGFIELSNGAASTIEEECKSVIAASLKRLYRRIYLMNFLVNIKRPVDFTNKETYFTETANLLADALGMEMVAIRKLTSQGDLECVAFFHGKQERRVDFPKEQIPLPFAEVLNSAISTLESEDSENSLEPAFEIVDNIESERFTFLRSDPYLRSVKAFAIFPVVVDNSVFGIISCCTSSPIDFCEFQRMAISTTMQIVSVAISNFYSYHEAKLLEATRTDQLFDMMALEIAQATRHELSNLQTDLTLQHIQMRGCIRDKSVQVQKILTKQGELIDSLSTTINKLRINTASGSTPKLTEDSVRNIWDSAIVLIQTRLTSMNVKVSYTGAPLNDWFYSDWLRSAFLNLLFNSLDAFADRPKSNRVIRLVAHKESDSAQHYVLNYSDTAGGIAFPKLVIPENIRDSHPNMDSYQLIFQPKVTSKKTGSGWGLYLVRRAIDMHKGSVNLKSNTSEGCVFHITLRKNLAEVLKYSR
jgi:signal transduction histidine kinase